MNDSPSVSIVVPFFDSESTIEACIESLLAQEIPGGSIEIIMVNNGSTDASASIAARYGDLTLLAEATPGAYAARNTGIRRASAPLIAFTDADCSVGPRWVESIMIGMEDPLNAILVGHCGYPASASIALRLLSLYENAKTEYVTRRCQPDHHFAICNNMAVRASVFAQLGLFEEWKRAADTELVHRVHARRPDLRLAYLDSMRITHLEFARARDRAERLRLYARTNSKIATFRELSTWQRLSVLMHLVRWRRAA